jgi:spectrin alpha
MSYPDFFQTGLSASQQQLVDRSSVGARQAQIEKLYANILNLCQERAKRLGETCKAYQLVREAAELANWIKTKEQHAQIQVLQYTVLKIYPKAPYEMRHVQKLSAC